MLGAEDRGAVTQKDTYFEVRQGRLKLREESGAAAHLIAYERPNLNGQKESSYQLVEVREPAELQSTLADVLGIGAVVRKTRRLFIFEGVRIHLDHVDGLGNFIEFEGVAGEDGDLGGFAELLASLQKSFGIRDADVLSGSYSDLLKGKAAGR